MFPRPRPGGVFNPTHTTVESLLMFVHDIREYRIVGGPGWMRHDLFRIDARAGVDASPEQIKMMVRALLEDRFNLVTHTERREMGFQALVRARPDGPAGPDLIRMDGCSRETIRELRTNFPARYPMPFDGIVSGCHALGDFADSLAIRLGVPVLDETGLMGDYYYTLRAQLPNSRISGLGLPVGPTQDFPSLPTALEQQLGLKLESRRGPIDVLVVDSVQQPTEN